MSEGGPGIGARVASSVLGGLFDATIALGYGRPGYWARSLAFDPGDMRVSLKGKTALVTGASAGIGKATAKGLARLGAEVWLLCRDRKRGQAAVDEIRRATKSDLVSVEVVDMSSLASIRELAARFPVEQVDILVHNAGMMTHERKLTDEGIEVTFATHVVGPFLLTQLLLPKLGASGDAGARVIFVSSGGMYSVKLSLDDLDWSKRPFDGVKAYAMAKRAQVVLAEILDQKLTNMYVHCASMHPGWVDTEAVRVALPKFYERTKRILRTHDQGADTVIWLAASKRAALPQGQFYCDRMPRTMHLRKSTIEDGLERGHLYTTCMKLSSVGEGAPASKGDAAPSTAKSGAGGKGKKPAG